MKIMLSILLTLLLLLQVLYLPVKVLCLESNRDAIARDLCINRDKPQLMCQGSCYINQMVAEAVNHGDADTSLPATSQQEQRAFSPFLPGNLLFPATPVFIASARPGYQPRSCFTTLAPGIFRPPRLT